MIKMLLIEGKMTLRLIKFPNTQNFTADGMSKILVLMLFQFHFKEI
jgi:hypothetical protein